MPRTQLREEANASRERIAGTVGEMRGAVEQAKVDAVATAKRNAPIVAAGIAALVLLRLSMRSSRPK